MSARPKVVVTGIGLVTSIGNDLATVTEALRELRHGFECPPEYDTPDSPVRVVGTVKGFGVDSTDPEDWTYPEGMRLKREIIRGLPPHGLYVWHALLQAIRDAGLDAADLSEPETGMFTASGGSPFLMHRNFQRMDRLGVMRCHPLGIVASIAGTLSFNLVAAFKIKGASCGFSSACASSGHALGYAVEEIRSGRQRRMLVVAGEDCNRDSILPFAGMRALTLSRDPDTASRPFDRRRDGFVGTGGGAVMVVEREDLARERGARVYGEIAGWGQASDGHNVAISHPDGEGLVRAMRHALADAGVGLEAVDYINAHATSTLIGDTSELRAIKTVFGPLAGRPSISSTKALTGHGLSLASLMEAAFCLLAMQGGFTPGCAHLEEPDPEAAGFNLPRTTLNRPPRVALSNSSGFGGANTSLVLRSADLPAHV
ncbi:MAG: beta-ketoacyl-[acyl-carrier-protein] synthase family protein [Puniceicoccaceae bacterium]|nr:MAG: beta-ketoacyl-[acyl-carrier-protein] synthase family protein [Puniceicoccaceae bacterium]